MSEKKFHVAKKKNKKHQKNIKRTSKNDIRHNLEIYSKLAKFPAIKKKFHIQLIYISNILKYNQKHSIHEKNNICWLFVITMNKIFYIYRFQLQ